MLKLVLTLSPLIYSSMYVEEAKYLYKI